MKPIDNILHPNNALLDWKLFSSRYQRLIKWLGHSAVHRDIEKACLLFTAESRNKIISPSFRC